jgi:hypothetical protein
MLHKKAIKEPVNPTPASVKKEMSMPRMARSARIAELKLDHARISQQPSATLPRTVDKIIPSLRSSQVEQAQIVIDGAEHGYRDICIENTLTDEYGDEVKLKKGAEVDVTITANPKT